MPIFLQSSFVRIQYTNKQWWSFFTIIGTCISNDQKILYTVYTMHMHMFRVILLYFWVPFSSSHLERFTSQYSQLLPQNKIKDQRERWGDDIKKRGNPCCGDLDPERHLCINYVIVHELFKPLRSPLELNHSLLNHGVIQILVTVRRFHFKLILSEKRNQVRVCERVSDRQWNSDTVYRNKEVITEYTYKAAKRQLWNK